MAIARIAGISLFAAGLAVTAMVSGLLFSAEPISETSGSDASSRGQRIAAAIKLGLPLVEQAASRYPTHRKCFSCHHQTLPMLAMVAARESNLTVDPATLKTQAEFTHASFVSQLEGVREGKEIGGRAMTVGYGLWALKLAGWEADETTEGLVSYLLKSQHAEGYWQRQTDRPPMEESNVMCSVLAIGGIRKFAGAAQKEDADLAILKAKAWLMTVVPKSQEDKAARLWAWSLLEAEPQKLAEARAAAISTQRPDGGWAQIDGMESDAYATGLTLYVLRITRTSATDAPYERGVEYLLKGQHEDGTWFVKTRSKPVQVYFDNGDAHGKDQFISTPATCWALTALAQSIERPK